MQKSDVTLAFLAVIFCAVLWVTLEIVVDPAPSVRMSFER